VPAAGLPAGAAPAVVVLASGRREPGPRARPRRGGHNRSQEPAQAGQGG